MPKKGKNKDNKPKSQAKPKKVAKPKAKPKPKPQPKPKPKPQPKPKASRNPKQTARRIPAKVGASSRAPLTQVVAPDGSRGGVGAYNPRRTPQEIQAEKEAQARLTLGISDFPQPRRQAPARQPSRRIQEPVGGFTGLTSGYGITPNKEKLLNAKITDMEARLTAEINKQNQPNNPAQDPAPAQRQRRQRGVLRRGDVEARRPPAEQELEAETTFISPEEQARRRAVARTRDARKHARTEIYTPLPITESSERVDEEKRVQDIRDELDKQTKQVEAQSTISRILKEANDKVKEKERIKKEKEKEIQEPFIQARKLYEEKQKEKEKSKIVDDIMGGEKEKEILLTAEQENFKVGGEIEVPFKSQEELLEAFRNRPNQPKPLEPLVVEEVVEEVDSDDDFKSVEGFDEIEPDEETTQAFNQARELYERKQREKQKDRSNITLSTSVRDKPKENDPQNLLNVSSLRRDIKDSFGQASLKILREEQAEREKTKEDFGASSVATLRREQAERERLRTRPLPPTPVRELPVPPNLREREAPKIAREIVDDLVDTAFDTATENAKRLEKERKEKQRKDREEERKRVAQGFIQSSLERGIRGAVDTQERRDRGGARAERDRSRRTATADVSDIVDDLIGRSIVKAQAKETQVRAGGQGRRGTDIEREVRKYRSNLISAGIEQGGGAGAEGDEEKIKRYRDRLEARQVIQEDKNRNLEALMNLGVNGQYIPFNARDLIRITNSANDREQLSRLRELLRNDRREEVRKLEKEIMDLAIQLIRLKKDEKDESNKIAKLRKRI